MPPIVTNGGFVKNEIINSAVRGRAVWSDEERTAPVYVVCAIAKVVLDLPDIR